MNNALKNKLQVNLSPQDHKNRLMDLAKERRWGLALVLIGWLHLVAFLSCYYLTIVCDYHEAPGYLTIWISELFGMWLIFRICAKWCPLPKPSNPLELYIRRVWIAYFLLAFNLGTMNTLRGHRMFELFPATASLASFAFIMLSIVINWRFIFAMLVMFASGLLMAAHLWHAFLIFAVAWWVVLNWIGGELWFRVYQRETNSDPLPHSSCGEVYVEAQN